MFPLHQKVDVIVEHLNIPESELNALLNKHLLHPSIRLYSQIGRTGVRSRYPSSLTNADLWWDFEFESPKEFNRVQATMRELVERTFSLIDEATRMWGSGYVIEAVFFGISDSGGLKNRIIGDSRKNKDLDTLLKTYVKDKTKFKERFNCEGGGIHFTFHLVEEIEDDMFL